MRRRNVARSVDVPDSRQLPVQAVDNPVLSSPYAEPNEHWLYKDGVPQKAPGRRPASYYYETQAGRAGTAQTEIFAEEQRAELPLVNRLRKDVARWREANYRGVSRVTLDLLAHWKSPDRARPLFFCQLEAVETLIYLLEIRLPRRSSRTQFRNFDLPDVDLDRLLKNEAPDFPEIRGASGQLLSCPSLVDPPADESLLPLLRLGCKMATGSGKTVVMAMLITWAFCNRAINAQSREFPNGVLICCPNLTVKERLQVLRPEHPQNYYHEFDLVPGRYREFLNQGRVHVTNWHVFAPYSPHREGDTTFKVVDKGDETNDAFARNRLGELAGRLPILVLNDEGHHCWRPKAALPDVSKKKDKPTKEEKELDELEQEEARVWLDGLDRINNSGLRGPAKSAILACVDLSATPFYLTASGHDSGQPFPWLVSDFGLVDAIESGIVKIPRLPVRDDSGETDDAGRPDPKYFRLWRNVVDDLPQSKLHQNGRPKPEAIWEEVEPALLTLAMQWKKKFDADAASQPGETTIPPVLIVVCDNTEIAQVFYTKLSGEHLEQEADAKGKVRDVVRFGESAVLPEFSNKEGNQRTIQIDSATLKKLQGGDDEVQAIRQIIASVGKRGMPGEQIRCVVSVSMLTEGWDASNVTHILGVRAFESQLLCEQVVGRGLRRQNYRVDPHTGKLPPEHVDIYGIPFTLIPFKKTPAETEPAEQRRNRVFARDDRKAFEMRLPVVESYVYALREEGITCDVSSLDGFIISDEPTEVYLQETRGYNEGGTKIIFGAFEKQDRTAYYETVHLQTLKFRLAQVIVDQLLEGSTLRNEADRAAFRLKARHQLFPSVFRIVDEYVETKVTTAPGVDKRELGLEKYSKLLVERLIPAIQPGAASSESPLLPILNSFRRFYSTASVDFETVRPITPLSKSHLNAAAFLSKEERWAADVLEDLESVEFFTPNDRRVGLVIKYDYEEQEREYIPDFVIRLTGGLTLMLEIKGGGGEVWDPNVVAAKSAAAKKWVAAINNYGQFGTWGFDLCRAVDGDTQWTFTAKVRQLIEKYAPAEKAVVLPFRKVEPAESEKFVTCVPVISIRAAAGAFSEEQMSFASTVAGADDWAEVDVGVRLGEGMFLAQVKGRSMEPRIPDGSWCLFRPAPQGSREGRTVLVWSEAISDPETGGRYTVKRYSSEKVLDPDGRFRHTKITLKAENPEFEPIVLTPKDEGSVRVIAELVEVVGK